MDSNDLTLIWQNQAVFNARVRRAPTTWAERCAATRDLSLGLVSEVHDLLRALAWKPHRLDVPQENAAQVRHELGDLLKYLVSMCQVWEVAPADLKRLYWQVSRVVEQRWRQEHDEPGARRVAVVDVDGVLCNYRRGLCDWLRGRGYITQHTSDRALAGRWLDAGALGVNEGTWQRWKHEFRVSGAKTRLPVYPEGVSMLYELEAQNYYCALVTSRPVAEYPHLRDDTVEWLAFNRIPYNSLWFSREKHQEVVRRGLEQQAVLALDDDPAFCRQLARLPNCLVYHIGWTGLPWDVEVHGKIPERVRSIKSFQEVSLGSSFATATTAGTTAGTATPDTGDGARANL